jgi:anti-sigma regulatory factor (Ser/Thr protein kinase)
MSITMRSATLRHTWRIGVRPRGRGIGDIDSAAVGPSRRAPVAGVRTAHDAAEDFDVADHDSWLGGLSGCGGRAVTPERAADGTAAEFVHAALVIGADEDLSAVLLPALHRWVDTYDEVLLVVGEHTRAVLAEDAPDPAGVLYWGDPAAFYQRLGFAYENFRRHLAERHKAGRRVHVIAEPDLTSGVDAGLRAGRVAAYLAYEAVCNKTYAFGGSAVTCLWDSRHHPDAVIEGVRATHPQVLTATGRAPWPQYVPPERYLAGRADVPMRPVPAHVEQEMTLHEVTELSVLRTVIGGWAAGHGFAAEASEDLMVAVVEVATNGLRHGRTAVRVRAWHHGDTLIVQCDDAGGRPIPAVTGYHRPSPLAAAAGGRGLWLARQLADVVTTSSVPGRTSVRMYFPQRLMRSPRS